MSKQITARNNFAWRTSALTLLLLRVVFADQSDLHRGQPALQGGFQP